MTTLALIRLLRDVLHQLHAAQTDTDRRIICSTLIITLTHRLATPGDSLSGL